MCRLSTEFCENPLSRLYTFCVILLTNRLTNADENTTSLAETNDNRTHCYCYTVHTDVIFVEDCNHFFVFIRQAAAGAKICDFFNIVELCANTRQTDDVTL